MCALMAILAAEAHAKLADAIKSEYKKQADGTFVLDVTPVDGMVLENVTGLKSALQEERNGRKTLDDKLKDFEGLDPKIARDAITKVKEFTNFDPDKKVAEALKLKEKQLEEKYENAHLQSQKKWDETEAEYKARLTERDAELDVLTIEQTATQMLTKPNVGGSVELLLPHIKARAKRVVENGKSKVVVVGDDGKPRVSPKPGYHGDMTIEDLITELKGKPEFAPAFKATASGSGAGGTGASTRSSGSQLIIGYEESKDVAKYRAAREQAAKAGQTLVVANKE